jgi:hypothetical protein
MDGKRKALTSLKSEGGMNSPARGTINCENSIIRVLMDSLNSYGISATEGTLVSY